MESAACARRQADLPLAKLSGENFKEVIFRVAGQNIQRVDLFLRQQDAPPDIAKLLKINKGAAASADGDEITVEIVSSFLAVDN